MLALSGAAARMVRDFDQRQTRQTEKLRLGSAQLHKNGLAQGDRRLALFLQFDGVVDTPRRARPSSAQAGDDGVTTAQKFLHDRFWRALHMGGLGLEDHFLGGVFLLNQFGQFLKHGGGIGLAVVDDADDFSFQSVQARHQRPAFRIYCRARVEKL